MLLTKIRFNYSITSKEKVNYCSPLNWSLQNNVQLAQDNQITINGSFEHLSISVVESKWTQRRVHIFHTLFSFGSTVTSESCHINLLHPLWWQWMNGYQQLRVWRTGHLWLSRASPPETNCSSVLGPTTWQGPALLPLWLSPSPSERSCVSVNWFQ